MGKLTFITFIFITFSLAAQSSLKPILLQNPSFEDDPGFSRTPRGWFFCGEIGETPPDIHPYDAMYGVTHEPKRGNTYIGMVTRDNNTWEGLSQWLPQSLEAGQCYRFSLHAARSPYYQSVSRSTWQFVNYDQPVVLRLWGGNLNCEKAELLAVSAPVESADWHQIDFQFQPKINYNRIVIEAFYTTPASPYCGNVLLDATAPILPVYCNNGQPSIALETLFNTEPFSETTIQNLAEQILFSEIDQQLSQHAFYLPSGELYQANKPLFILSQMLKNAPEQRLTFYVNEENKRYFKIKYDHLWREMLAYGVSPRQFRIQKYRAPKNESPMKVEVMVAVE